MRNLKSLSPGAPPSAAYRAVTRAGLPVGCHLWHSPLDDDPVWDDFLRATPCGQFQQSSLWARFKKAEGWQHHREILTGPQGETLGGFQVLWRRKGPLRIGYISKGPAVSQETPGQAALFSAVITASARELGLSMLILQQPDESSEFLHAVPDSPWIRSNPMHVVDATYLVDVRPTPEAMRARMSASLRRNLRKARQQPSQVVVGGEEDLPVFFELMRATCERQGVKPNPPSLAALRELWRHFAPANAVRLTLLRCADGTTPAGKLSIRFGNCLTVWKKGWDGTHNQVHPNELLEEESLEWAHGQGLASCDFCSFSRTVAEEILRNPDARLPLSSRDEYHLRFGGQPKVLAPPLVLLPNPLLRMLYRQTYVRRERSRTRPRTATIPAPSTGTNALPSNRPPASP